MSDSSFHKEVSEMATSDIILILEDQLELYTEEEIKILKKELINRSKSSKEIAMNIEKLYNQFPEIEDRKIRREIEKEKTRIKDKINTLAEMGYTEYYEYTAINIIDDEAGFVNVSNMIQQINDLALDG